MSNFQPVSGMNQKRKMKHTIRKQALETVWRREFTADERAWLEGHLGGDDAQRLLFEEEEALSRLLTGVPNAPLSSNFTARVVAAARLEEARSARGGGDLGTAGWLSRLAGYVKRSWVTQTTAAGLVVAIGLSVVYGVKAYQRQQFVQVLATVTQVAVIPEIEVLQDFDAIRLLGRVQAPRTTVEMDAALLAALQ